MNYYPIYRNGSRSFLGPRCETLEEVAELLTPIGCDLLGTMSDDLEVVKAPPPKDTPRRLTVEIREAKEGERYVAGDGVIKTRAAANPDQVYLVPVIVSEETNPGLDEVLSQIKSAGASTKSMREAAAEVFG